jgi:hypothetical protein
MSDATNASKSRLANCMLGRFISVVSRHVNSLDALFLGVLDGGTQG